MVNSWDLFYSSLDVCLNETDFKKARSVIEIGVRRANELYCDPRLILKQLNYYKSLIDRLEPKTVSTESVV